MTYPFDQHVTFLYTADLRATAYFYENTLVLPLVLDQGGCRIYGVAASAFLGFCSHSSAGQRENTAGVVRAYLEAGLHKRAPLQKLYYYGEQFRHESAQKKRYREFTQAGVELIGSEHPEADVEVISLAVEFFKALGLGDVRVELSTFGCPECRPDFREALLEYFKGHEASLCRDCKRRLERNDPAPGP